MPYMLNPANYTQTMRPNLYNMAYRRIGAYKGMGRLHPSNYLEIGGRPNRIGATAGQYNTLSGQLSLLPPSLRGLGLWRRRGLGDTCAYNDLACLQASTGAWQVIGPPNILPPPSAPPSDQIPADYGKGANILDAYGNVLPGVFPTTGTNNNTLLLIGGGLLVLLLLGGRR